jgi:hypothetical protein
MSTLPGKRAASLPDEPTEIDDNGLITRVRGR